MDCRQEMVSGAPVRKRSLEHAPFPPGLGCSSKNVADLTYDEVAAKLIADNFLLTALELHTELVESGKELPRLKEYFSNPGNFEKQAAAKPPEISPTLARSSSQATLDSLDFGRYSEDGERAADERLAVLEFELRKARETIGSLRAHLTLAAESEANVPNRNVETPVYEDPTKPHEQRAINFLVNEYLLKHGYKLTSITFADENENQDFEDWDDVGLNISKPPDVVCQFRNWQHHAFPRVDACDSGCQTEGAWNVSELEADMRNMEKEMSEVKEELDMFALSKQELLEQLARYQSMESPVKDELDEHDLSEAIQAKGRPPPLKSVDDSIDSSVLQSLHGGSSLDESEAEVPVGYTGPTKLPEAEAKVEDRDHRDALCRDLELTLEKLRVESGETLFTPDIHLTTLLGASSQRQLPKAYQKIIVDACLHYQPSQQGKLSLDLATSAETSEKLVLLLAVCLPHVVPNVILNKREELIPLIVCTINLHPNPKARDTLLNLLFNLIKRPDASNRQMILTGFLSIAQHLGLHCVESELLPQCWEQIGHRYVERRLLVAEACSVLAPFTSSAIRNSLMLSMLQQMLLDDKDEQVREAAVKSLALVTAYVGDENKYSMCLELTLAAIQDQAECVNSAAIHLLVPVVAAWSLELDKLFNPLTTRVLGLLIDATQELVVRGPTGVVKVGVVSANDQRVVMFCTALKSIVPFLFLAVGQKAASSRDDQEPPANGVPFFPELQNPLEDPSIYWGELEKVQALAVAFNVHFTQEDSQTWPEVDWFTDNFLTELVKLHLQVSMNHQVIIMHWIKFYNHLSQMFGESFTLKKVREIFVKVMWPPQDETCDDVQTIGFRLTHSAVPIFVLGVLLAFPKPENIQEAVQTLKKVLWTLSLYRLPLDSIGFCVQELIGKSEYRELLLDMLWEGVVHTSVQVREAVAEILGVASQHVAEDYLASKVLPALVTLASDPEISVRVSTVSTFGLVSRKCTRKEIQDKAYLQLQTFVDDPMYKEQHGMQLALIHTLGRLATGDPRFRDDFILVRLATMAANNNRCTSRTRRSDVALALLDVYSGLLYAPLSKQLTMECVLPALKCLQLDVEELLAGQEDLVRGMVRELEARLELPLRGAHHERSGSLSLAAAGASVGQGVEDVKNRVSRLFQSKQTATLPGLFKKK